jgi:hypothetical protein
MYSVPAMFDGRDRTEKENVPGKQIEIQQSQLARIARKQMRKIYDKTKSKVQDEKEDLAQE